MAVDHHGQIDVTDQIFWTTDDRLDLPFPRNLLGALLLRSPDGNDAAAVSGDAIDVREPGEGKGVRVVRADDTDRDHW
jgi:hypothetical protein